MRSNVYFYPIMSIIVKKIKKFSSFPNIVYCIIGHLFIVMRKYSHRVAILLIYATKKMNMFIKCYICNCVLNKL